MKKYAVEISLLSIAFLLLLVVLIMPRGQYEEPPMSEEEYGENTNSVWEEEMMDGAGTNSYDK